MILGLYRDMENNLETSLILGLYTYWGYMRVILGYMAVILGITAKETVWRGPEHEGFSFEGSLQ